MLAPTSEFVEVSGHLVNLSVEMVLDGLDELGILGQHEVDGGTLSTVTTGTTNSVDVVLLLEWQLVVDDKTDLLHIDTSGQQVSGDQDTHGTGTELLHDDVSAELVHLTVHDGNGEVVLGHGLLQLFDSLLGVTVDESLVDVQVGVQVQEHVHLPLLLLDGDVVLADTLESELLVLDQNLRWLAHEVLGHGEDLWWQSGREQRDLDVSRQELENVLNLLFETTRQHLIGLVEHEQLQVVGLEETSLHHIVDTAWGTNDDVGTAALELLDVVLDDGTTDAGLHLDLLVLTNRVNDVGNLLRQFTSWRHNKSLAMVGDAALWVSVNALKHTNGKGTSLTSTRLSLGNSVLTLDKGEDTLALNWGWVFETVTVDTTQDFLPKAHVVKLINFQVPVRFENLFTSLILGLLLILILNLFLFVFSFLVRSDVRSMQS